MHTHVHIETIVHCDPLILSNAILTHRIPAPFLAGVALSLLLLSPLLSLTHTHKRPTKKFTISNECMVQLD